MEALWRHNAKLQAELDRLNEWRTTASDSFKLAWQEERSAHQRLSEQAATEKATAEVLTRQLAAELEGARARLEQQSTASEREVARLREELALARRHHAALKEQSGAQLRSLQRELAHVRAEKGALCEEFSQKLDAFSKGSLSLSRTALPPPAASDGMATEVDTKDDEATPSELPPEANLLERFEANSGYAQLSIFSEPSGAALQQVTPLATRTHIVVVRKYGAVPIARLGPGHIGYIWAARLHRLHRLRRSAHRSVGRGGTHERPSQHAMPVCRWSPR